MSGSAYIYVVSRSVVGVPTRMATEAAGVERPARTGPTRQAVALATCRAPMEDEVPRTASTPSSAAGGGGGGGGAPNGSGGNGGSGVGGFVAISVLELVR